VGAEGARANINPRATCGTHTGGERTGGQWPRGQQPPAAATAARGVWVVGRGGRAGAVGTKAAPTERGAGGGRPTLGDTSTRGGQLGDGLQPVVDELNRLYIQDQGAVGSAHTGDEAADAASTATTGKSRRSGASRRSAARARREAAVPSNAAEATDNGDTVRRDVVEQVEPPTERGDIHVGGELCEGPGRGANEGPGAPRAPKGKSRPAKQRSGYKSRDERFDDWIKAVDRGGVVMGYRRYGSDPSDLAAAYRTYRELLPAGHPNCLPKRKHREPEPMATPGEVRDLALMREAREVLPVDPEIHVLLEYDSIWEQGFQSYSAGGCARRRETFTAHWVCLELAPHVVAWKPWLPAKIAWRCVSSDCVDVQSCLKTAPLDVALLEDHRVVAWVQLDSATLIQMERGYRSEVQIYLGDRDEEAAELRIWPKRRRLDVTGAVICVEESSGGGEPCETQMSE